ncbi:hypothetical protein EYW47_29190 [Paraburkholderia silviterrae]|uniref:Uncharacterized protein n=1 Tax=Paraburkholderia silviterrae TaxID=2528715 RepID=A0A4R5M2D1_9BURK|nr:hypothetical protein EYW47_29190 [Paraburkholderia silviterrae]
MGGFRFDAEPGDGLFVSRYRPGDGSGWHGCLLVGMSACIRMGAADLSSMVGSSNIAINDKGNLEF